MFHLVYKLNACIIECQMSFLVCNKCLGLLFFAGNKTTDQLRAHRIGGNRKCSKQSTDADQKSLETVFSIAVCHQSGDE